MSSTTLNYTNPASGIAFSVEDLSGTGAGPYYPRSQVVGASTAEVAAVKNAAPATGAYGLVTRGFLYDSAGTALTFGQAVMASSMPVVVASNQSAIPTTAAQGTAAALAAAWPTKPTDGVNTMAMFDAQARAGYIRPRKLTTYRAAYRLAARPYVLSKVFTANTRVQFATIHHAATAIKLLKLRHIYIAVETNSVAAIAMFDLIRITSAPATGNPAITPATVNGGTAAEATCLALPTTAGTEAGGPWAFHEFNLGIVGAAPTTNPPQGLFWYDLMINNAAAGVAADHEKDLPQVAAGVLGGWSVTVDGNAATTLKGYVVIEFTEE